MEKESEENNTCGTGGGKKGIITLCDSPEVAVAIVTKRLSTFVLGGDGRVWMAGECAL